MQDDENGSLLLFHAAAGICLLITGALVLLRLLGVIDLDPFWCVFPVLFFVLAYIFFCVILIVIFMFSNRK